MLTIYTDGACSGNPGPGGWGIVFSDGRTFSGGEEMTTNNRMELMAAVIALKHVKENEPATLITDSEYLYKGITTWIHKWRINWLTAGNKPVKNADLWKELDIMNQHRCMSWQWTKGHSNCKGNIEADKLAVNAIPTAKDTTPVHKKMNTKAEISTYQ